MTTMSQADRAAFALTETRVAELKKKEAAARIVYAKAAAEFAKVELAYAKNFTPIVFAMITATGVVTPSSITLTLASLGFAPSHSLTDNIIRAHVTDGLLYEYRPRSEYAEAIYKATDRYACLAPV